jgi:hypothetical protein
MGGVDRQDATAVQPYDPRRTHKVAFHLVLVAVHNAHVVYQSRGGTKRFLHFLEACVMDLIENTGNARKRKAPAVRRPLSISASLALVNLVSA